MVTKPGAAFLRFAGLAGSCALLACGGARSAVPAPAAAPAVSPTTPGVARAPTCRIAGAPRIAATNIYGGEPVVQTRRGGFGFDVVVADQVEPCLTIGVASDGQPLGTVLGECAQSMPPGSAFARSPVETYKARVEYKASGEPQIVLGVVTYDWAHAQFGIAHEGQPHLVEHAFPVPPGGQGGGAADPALASFADDGFLLVWVEGDEVRAQPLWHWAEATAAPLRIALENTTDIGRPSVAFDGSDGLVAFSAQTPSGHHVIATPIVCAAR
jgi:hypothetical protein